MAARSSGINPAGGRGRLVRAGLILLLGWLALEFALLHLVADRIGWGLTVAFLSVKGGIGLVLLGYLTVRGLRGLRNHLRSGGHLKGGVRAGFAVASAVLISIPGLIPALVGIALFSPSLQLRVLRRFRPHESTTNVRDIDLSDAEWREIRTRKKRARLPKRDASLEARPPSV